MNNERTRKKTLSKYMIPMLSAFVLVVCLVVGIVYIHSFMIQQTTEERASQLDEMIEQIRVNLEYGLETHWNLLEGIDGSVEGNHFSDMRGSTKEREHFENVF